MPEIKSTEKLFSVMARRHFGIAPCFGGARFAQAKFGDEVVHIKYSQFGSIAFGVEVFGDVPRDG